MRRVRWNMFFLHTRHRPHTNSLPENPNDRSPSVRLYRLLFCLASSVFWPCEERAYWCTSISVTKKKSERSSSEFHGAQSVDRDLNWIARLRGSDYTVELLFQAYPWPHLIKRRFVISAATLPHVHSALSSRRAETFRRFRYERDLFAQSKPIHGLLRRRFPRSKLSAKVPGGGKGLRPHSSHAASSLFARSSHLVKKILAALDDGDKQKLQRSSSVVHKIHRRCRCSNSFCLVGRQQCFEMCQAMWDYLFNISEIIMLARLLTLDPRCSRKPLNINFFESSYGVRSTDRLSLKLQFLLKTASLCLSLYLIYICPFQPGLGRRDKANSVRETKAKDANTFDHNKS